MLLFDGRTSADARIRGSPRSRETGWVVEDGWLKHRAKGGGGDIITTNRYKHFELDSPGGLPRVPTAG